MASLLALGAAALFGTADFVGGYASRKVDAIAVALGSNLAGLLTALVLLAIVGGEWSVRTVAFGLLSGLAAAAGLTLLFTALSSGPFQLVSPLAAVLSGVVPVVVGFGLGERPGVLAVSGMMLAAPAVWLLAGGGFSGFDTSHRRALLTAMAAGVAFGLFFSLLAQTSDDSGAAPLILVKVAGVGVLAPLVGRARALGHAITPLALVSGSLDMLANGLFLWASRRGDLSVVGALVALFPAPNAVLAWAILKERLSSAQAVGFALALGAGVLLSS